jgi:hypothetical protein
LFSIILNCSFAGQIVCTDNVDRKSEPMTFPTKSKTSPEEKPNHLNSQKSMNSQNASDSLPNLNTSLPSIAVVSSTMGLPSATLHDETSHTEIQHASFVNPCDSIDTLSSFRQAEPNIIKTEANSLANSDNILKDLNSIIWSMVDERLLSLANAEKKLSLEEKRETKTSEIMEPKATTSDVGKGEACGDMGEGKENMKEEWIKVNWLLIFI